MKKFLLFAIAFNLSFADYVHAQAQVAACSINQTEIDALNLLTGAKRLEILSNATTILENPDLAKPIGDVADSQSAGMYMSAEVMGAASLAANEAQNNHSNAVVSARCTSVETIEDEKIEGTFQLFSSACTISELVNRITNQMTEADLLEQQAIEAKTGANQANAENMKRDAEIKKQKDKLEKLNKDITAAIKALDTAKKAHEKAKEAVEKAKEGLAKAQAIPCAQVCSAEGDCSEDCSARDAAVAEATKALDAANKALEKAAKALEKAVKKLVDLLTEKFGSETLAVFALLAGTMRGETDGDDVHFKIGSSDFTLINVGKAIVDAGGDGRVGVDKVNNFMGTDDIDEVEKNTSSYINYLMTRFDTSAEAGHVDRSTGTINGSEIYFMGTGVNGPDSQKEVLEIFAEKSLDNLETLALAVQDYGNQTISKQISTLEAMKTPQSRVDELNKQVETKQKLVDDIKIMIQKNLCYLDKILTMFKEMYKNSSESVQKKDAFFAFVNSFTTDKLKLKVKEGYFSKVNHKGIQKEFECYTKGGDANSCKNLSDDLAATQGAGSCHWSGAVIGPATPVKDICDASKVGQLTSNDSGNELVCKCL